MLEGGLQPVSPSKKNTSPAHRGEGAGAASAQPDLWAPAGWKKSSEHFSKSSLRQKLQSDRCKSPPELQLLPLLSQPRAASEVTFAPRVAGMVMGSVQEVVSAPQAPLRPGFCNRTSTGSSWGCARYPQHLEAQLNGWGIFQRMHDLSCEEHGAHLQKKGEMGLC